MIFQKYSRFHDPDTIWNKGPDNHLSYNNIGPNKLTKVQITHVQIHRINKVQITF
jgi:hypothetical protein